jgi:hypothetical protein
MLKYFFAAFLGLPLAGLAAAQSGGNDTLRARFTETKKEKVKGKDVEETRTIVDTRTGEVKDAPGGITFTDSSGKTIAISARDIVFVYYGKLAGVDDNTRRELPNIDNEGGQKALDFYVKLQKDTLTASDERTRRFLESRIAYWTARQTDVLAGDEFKKAAPAAIDKLVNFARSYPKAWESWGAMLMAARMQTELGKHNDAASTFVALGRTEGLAADLRNDAKLGELEANLRSGAALLNNAAAVKLDNPNESQKERFEIVQLALAAQKNRSDSAKLKADAKALADRIELCKEPANRAAGHNLLGEVYLQAKLPAEARWQFLWVEAVDNGDRDELVKALGRLAEVFETLGDKDRSALYRDKFLKAKSL